MTPNGVASAIGGGFSKTPPCKGDLVLALSTRATMAQRRKRPAEYEDPLHRDAEAPGSRLLRPMGRRRVYVPFTAKDAREPPSPPPVAHATDSGAGTWVATKWMVPVFSTWRLADRCHIAKFSNTVDYLLIRVCLSREVGKAALWPERALWSAFPQLAFRRYTGA